MSISLSNERACTLHMYISSWRRKNIPLSLSFEQKKKKQTLHDTLIQFVNCFRTYAICLMCVKSNCVGHQMAFAQCSDKIVKYLATELLLSCAIWTAINYQKNKKSTTSTGFTLEADCFFLCVILSKFTAGKMSSTLFFLFILHAAKFLIALNGNQLNGKCGKLNFQWYNIIKFNWNSICSLALMRNAIIKHVYF